MAKRRDLYLYLTLACFFAIITIFIVDGYMGVYDTIRITAGERPDKVEPDFWLRPESTYETWVNWGGKVFFNYEIANHQIGAYSAEVSVSVWRSQEKIRDLVTKQVTIGGLDNAQVEWAVDTVELIPDGVSQQQFFQYSVIIKRGDVERKIIITINPGTSPTPPKPVLPRPAQPG